MSEELLRLSEHNAQRSAHLKARGAVRAGVRCDTQACRQELVLADMLQQVLGNFPGVKVKCPGCSHRGVLLL